MSAKMPKLGPLDKVVTVRGLGHALTAMEAGFRTELERLEWRLTPWYTKVWRRIWRARRPKAAGSS